MNKHIKRALISVSDKTGIVELSRKLREFGIDIISTGGTARLLAESGIDVTEISDVTNFPEMMDGRVKTLHPLVHGGLLACRDDDVHMQAAREHGIGMIDLLIINLYPFEETVASTSEEEAIIENIDIGGPAMIRSAAKNHGDVTVIISSDDYPRLTQQLEEHGGATSLPFRREMAGRAFARTNAYDGAIAAWFASKSDQQFPQTLSTSYALDKVLRYGENPHQKAALYRGTPESGSIAHAAQLQGKELSYNNIADSDAAWELAAEFDAPTVAIIKHANPCGVASAESLHLAYKGALDGDPVSAYGGIIAVNREMDEQTAREIRSLFAEVIIAPKFSIAAREIFARKKNLRLLETGAMPNAAARHMLQRSISGGLLVQERDHNALPDEAQLRVVSKRQPTDGEMRDMEFAFKVCKHVRSNAIVFASGTTVSGVGAGQMSRIDSVRIAVQKARETARHVEDARGSVMASDAFFPFADGVEIAAEAGITAVIHPGGSIRDEEVIAAADANNMAMIMTGLRHFRH